MASKPAVTLTFAGDEKKLLQSIDKSVNATQEMTRKVNSSSSDMAAKTTQSSDQVRRAFANTGSILMAQGAAFAANQVVGFFRGMVDEAREAEKTARSTAQGIATIGAASWITAQQVGDLSEAISEKIGVDDELIQQSANLLLTFSKVRNEVGEGNKIFDRAVLAAQDLAAKGFGDADSAAKMLGKALNDPIAGITALSRAGVTFSQSQKDQIKNMVEHGNLLGAQKLLLKEVEAQVGGTAEATASAGDKMKVTWANFQEQLGEQVLPIVDKALGHLMKFLDWAQEHPQIVIAIGAITAAIWLLNAALSANPVVLVAVAIAGLVVGLILLWEKSAAFRDFFINMWTGIRTVVSMIVSGILDRWKAVVDFFSGLPDRIGRALGALGGVISAAFKGAVNAAVDLLNKGVNLINKLIHGINAVNPFGTIPDIPHIPRMHQGGIVGGAPGTEVLRVLQAGEEVKARGSSASSASGGGPFVISVPLVAQIQAWFTDGTLVLQGR